MTLPDEMFNSIRSARMFMTALMDPALTPKVPKEIRSRARDRLKHFPSEFEINRLEEMFNTMNQDQNILIAETNKEIKSVTNGLFLAQHSLNRVASALEKIINTGRGK